MHRVSHMYVFMCMYVCMPVLVYVYMCISVFVTSLIALEIGVCVCSGIEFLYTYYTCV